MKARIVNGREAERKARKRAKKWRIAVTIRLISCRKCWRKEEEGGITGLATTIHQVNPKNRRMEGRNDKQMKS